MLILAVRRRGENNFIYAPSMQEKIQDGDTLILLGDINQMDALNELLKP